MSFSRIVILLSFLGAAVFGYLYYQEREKQGVLDDFLYELNGPKSIQALVQKSLELNDLQDRVSGSEFSMDGDLSLDSYIRDCAYEAEAGQVVATPKTDVLDRGRIEDVVYTIKPDAANDAQFSRLTIANLAYRLESKDPRVRVTRLEMGHPRGVKLDPHELHEADMWTWEIEVRVRRRVDDA